MVAAGAVAYLVALSPHRTGVRDIVMALAVAGKSVDISFLRSFSSDTVIDYAKPMLALTAAGEDPRTYPDED